MDQQGNKFDNGKLRYDLLPFASIDEVVKVLTFGAEKYVDNNWQLVKGPEKWTNLHVKWASVWNNKDRKIIMYIQSDKGHKRQIMFCLLLFIMGIIIGMMIKGC